jgi:hypothetical protein
MGSVNFSGGYPMRKLLLCVLTLLVVLFPLSCLMKKKVDKSDSEPPEPIRESQPDGRKIYDKSSEEDDNSPEHFPFSRQFDSDSGVEECDTSEVVYKTEPEEIDSSFFSGLPFEKEIDGSITVEPRAIFPDVEVYLKDAEIVLDKGGNFDFVKRSRLWVEKKSDSHLLAWIDNVPDNSQKLDLKTDSRIELSQYLDKGTVLRYRIGASEPKNDIKIHAELTLVGATNCD